MINLNVFAKGIYPTTEIYPMLKNCLITEDVFICSNDYLTLNYNLKDSRFIGCFDTKTILNIITKLSINKPYTVQKIDGGINILQGNFSLFISEIPPHQYPLSKQTEYTEEIFNPLLIDIFKELIPFVGIDASRSWCLGFHFINDTQMFVSNNTVVCGLMLPFTQKTKFVPSYLIEKIIQLADKKFIPEYWIENDTFIGVKYKEGHLLYSRKSAEPMDLSKPLMDDGTEQWINITQEIIDGVESVVSFTDEIYIDFDKDTIQSHRGNAGAKVKTNIDFRTGGAFVHKYFIGLLKIHSHIKFLDKKVMFYKQKNGIQYYSAEVRYVI